MKRFALIILLGAAFPVFAQDTARAKQNSVEYDTILVPKTRQDSLKRPDTKVTFRNKKKIYRPTRLGSSSPRYDTYKKNKEGAGAVTTDTKKIEVTPGESPADSVFQQRDSTIRAQDSVRTKPRKNGRQSKKD